MERLTEFEEHIVRGIDHRVDRPHPAVEQTALHPPRRRPDRHPADHSRHIPWAEGRIGDFDRGQLCGVFGTFGELEVKWEEPTTDRYRGFACKTSVIHSVGAIGGHLDIPFLGTVTLLAKFYQTAAIGQPFGQRVEIGGTVEIFRQPIRVEDHANCLVNR